MNSVDPLKDLHLGVSKIASGSVDAFSGLLVHFSNVTRIWLRRNITSICIYLALSVVMVLVLALLCFAAISALITEYDFKSWESVLIVALALLGITLTTFGLYKLIYLQKNDNQIIALANPTLVKSLSHDLEEGTTEVFRSLRKIFSFQELVVRNPIESLGISGLLGTFLGYWLASKNSNLDSISQHLSNQVLTSNLQENKNDNENSKINQTQKTKPLSKQLIYTIFNMTLPYVLPAIEKKISSTVDALLNNDVAQKNVDNS